MAEFSKGTSTDPTLMQGDLANTSKELKELASQESISVSPDLPIGELSEIGIAASHDLSRIGRMEFSGGVNVEILVQRNSAGEVSTYYLAPLIPRKNEDGSVASQSSNNTFFAFTGNLRLGRTKTGQRNDGSPVDLTVDLADLGILVIGTVSREQLEISVGENGINIRNIAQTSAEDPRIGRFRVERSVAQQETEAEITQPRAIFAPPEGVPVAMPDEEVAAQQAKLEDEAQAAVVEAFSELGEQPIGPSSEVQNIIGDQIAQLQAGEGVPVVVNVSESETLDESVSAAQRIIEDQIKNGEGNPVVVKLEKPTVEIEAVPETQEEQLTPEERIREACQTPASLLEGLKDPEMPQDLKNAVRRLVEAYRDTNTAGQVGEMWNSDVVPKLKKIGDAPQEIQKAIESTTGDLMSRKTTLINAMNGAVSNRGGMFDDGNVDSMRRVKNEAEHIRDQLVSGSHKKALSKLVDTARRSGVGAMYSEDEITSLGRRLSRNDDPPTMEDLEAIFANNANSIRNGLEGIRSVTNTLTANNEESSPNWRRRRDNIQVLFGLLSRINQDDAVAGTSTQEVHAVNLLDAVIDGANKVYGAMREGAYPQNRVNTLQNEVVPTAIRGLDVVFKQSDDLKQLALRLQSMVAEIK